ncbi:MAG: HEAT repeat domain-containing protein [Candidatus Lokiarchaeota archaeon]|nr:HEAT repeat domain-containing protein [Candidatus Lokiarchaeota archaeon]
MDWIVVNENFNALIKQLFHAKEWESRVEAAKQLGFLRDGRAVNLLCRALKSERDNSVIIRIIEALGRIGNGKATLRIIEKLNNETTKNEFDRRTVLFIIESLMRIKDKRALPHLSKFLTSNFEEIRQLTEKAFNEIEPRWNEIINEATRKKTTEEIFNSRY